MAELQRFVDAQAPVWDTVRAELAAAAKRTHWMWFVFPQIDGLGHSAMARHYAIASLAEARDYLAHPLLGARLQEAVALLLAAPASRSALQILGSPDDLKLRSCLTLFMAAAPGDTVFARALQRFYGGEPDARTRERIDQSIGPGEHSAMRR